jgi:hypothetical protein
VMTATKIKKVTQVGIARTLNDVGCRKAGSSHSKMVRGYSTPTSGWTSTQLDDGNFRIQYKVAYGTYNKECRVGLTDAERIETHEVCTKLFITKLNGYAEVLAAKGYKVEVVVEMVDGRIAFGDFKNRTYKKAKCAEGYVTVFSAEVA